MRIHTVLKKTKTSLFVILLYTIFSSQVVILAREVPVFCPLPITESKTVIIGWLKDSGFKTTQISLEAGQFEINAVKGNEMWRIILKPYSPLASSVAAEYTLDNLPDHDKVRQLKKFIDNYKEYLNEGVPRAVLSHNEHIVCIKAGTKEESIQFSGFVIGKEGLIIATAHDLDTVQHVTVWLNNGDKLIGSVIKIDFERDLSLIDVNKKIYSSISLTKARNLLEIGEPVYSISCSSNYQSKIYSGIINGPPGRVNNMPLWQVEMHTPHGSSGGPVFDMQGNLVGIVKGRYRGTNTRGFLITMETLTEFLRAD